MRMGSLRAGSRTVRDPNSACLGSGMPMSQGTLGPKQVLGALSYTTSDPISLLGVGLDGDSSPRMIAFQARLEF